MLILSPEYTTRYAIKEELINGLEGYVQLIHFLDPHDSAKTPLWQLYNVYLHTADKQHEQLKQLQLILEYAKTKPNPPFTYVTGDFNFVQSSMDTTSVSDQTILHGKRKTVWDEILKLLHITEVKADFHTRFKICQELPSSESARLDRFYIPASEAILSV